MRVSGLVTTIRLYNVYVRVSGLVTAIRLYMCVYWV